MTFPWDEDAPMPWAMPEGWAARVHAAVKKKTKEDAVVVRPPVPAPEVPSRPTTDEELASCASAHRTVKKASKNGWMVWSFWARGPLIGDDGKVLEIVNSIGLRMTRDGERITAVWVTRKDAWKLQSVRQGMTRMTFDEMNAHLVEPIEERHQL